MHALTLYILVIENQMISLCKWHQRTSLIFKELSINSEELGFECMYGSFASPNKCSSMECDKMIKFCVQEDGIAEVELFDHL